MKTWTRIPQVKARLLKKWERGFFLAQALTPDQFEPLRIPLKHPSSKELSLHFDAARTWIADIQSSTPKGQFFEIQWQEVNHRTLGRNSLPKAIVFERLDSLLSFLGKTREAGTYKDLFTRITGEFPELAAPLAQRPMEVLAHEGVWDQLLAVVACMKDSPSPGLYIRQLEIPGVDTKFIQAHRALLTRLLTAALPPDAVDQTAKGAAAFEQRFGFRSKPARIRFRLLDPALAIMGLTDLEIPAEDFAALAIRPDLIFIVENDISGLSFPEVPRAMVILGLGYSLSTLAQARWMRNLPLWYWSDLDTDGFAMLNQLRHHFPQARSFLMDEATLLAHRHLWGEDPSPAIRDLPLLTPKEAAVYEALRDDRFARNLRLEQERISFTLVRKTVEKIQRVGPTPGQK